MVLSVLLHVLLGILLLLIPPVEQVKHLEGAWHDASKSWGQAPVGLAEGKVVTIYFKYILKVGPAVFLEKLVFQ